MKLPCIMSHISTVRGVLRALQLRPVKRMKFSFDPYRPNVRSIREFLYQMNSPKLLDTNPACLMKLDVKSDLSPPKIEIDFIDDTKFIFLTEHLTTADIVLRVSSLCHLKDPKKDKDDRLMSKGAKKAHIQKR